MTSLRSFNVQMRCGHRPMATASAMSSTATLTTPISVTSNASFARFPRANCRKTCAADPTIYPMKKSPGARKKLWERGATEVCMQGGIHPEYTGETYLNIVRTVKAAEPNIHVHAFSPLEVWQGAATLNEVGEYLQQLKDVGLNTRCSAPPRKFWTTSETLSAPTRSIPSNGCRSWRRHTASASRPQRQLRTATLSITGTLGQTHHAGAELLQERTGGFTEFVPLPFVHMEAPMYLKGKAQRTDAFREAILMHSVARLALHGQISNIQTSWVKKWP